MTGAQPNHELAGDRPIGVLDALRTVLVRSLDRHVTSNEVVKQAFENLSAELEVVALNERLALPSFVTTPGAAHTT